MHRRDLLELLGAAAVIPFLRPLSAEARLDVARAVHSRVAGGSLRVLDARQHALVSEIAELIIPRTDTPGARDVGVPQFVDLVLAEWHTADERASFLTGLDALDARCRERHGVGFLDLDADRRLGLLAELDVSGTPETAEGGFRRLKELTLVGYFTSQPVMTDVLRHPIIPGRFDGCVPVAPRSP